MECPNDECDTVFIAGMTAYQCPLCGEKVDPEDVPGS